MISICVPYWDRQQALDAMFANYAQMYLGNMFEFSVCDDGSPVPAVAPGGTTLTRLPAKAGPLNPCVPINRAVAASSGNIIVITNPEIEHPVCVLHEMYGRLGDPAVDYVVAPCYDTARGIWVAGPQTNSKGRESIPPGGHFHFMAMLRRSLWDEVGGFDEDYRNGQACDDNDWLWRLYAAGARFAVTEGYVLHRATGRRIRWGLPHNRLLFRSKWPLTKRAALIHTRGETDDDAALNT